MEYMSQYVADKAYIAPQGGSESCKEYKRRIYTTMVVLLRETPEPPAMRIQRLWPNNAWEQIWHNLHEAPVSDDVKMRRLRKSLSKILDRMGKRLICLYDVTRVGGFPGLWIMII
jgi:hypothetical protein